MGLKKVGDYDADSYGWAEQEYLLLLKPYLKTIGNTAGKKILDVGCGPGWLTKIIARDARKVVGIDISEGMIARAKIENSAQNIDYYSLNATKIKNLNQTFDVIVSALMMHAVSPYSNLIKVLASCNSVLKENGSLVMLVPHPCFCDRNKRDYNTYTFLKKFNYFDNSQFYNVRLKSKKGVSEFKCPFYNLEAYFNAFNKAGFIVSDIVEPQVSKEYMKRKNLWSTELQFPFYVIFKLEKML